jgi:hypothetical protein
VPHHYLPLSGIDNNPAQVTPSSQTLIRYTTPAPVGPLNVQLAMPTSVPTTEYGGLLPGGQLPGPSYVRPPGPLHSTT